MMGVASNNKNVQLPPATIAVDLPPVPLTDVLLVVLIVLLWRCLSLLGEGVQLLRDIRSQNMRNGTSADAVDSISRPRAMRAIGQAPGPTAREATPLLPVAASTPRPTMQAIHVLRGKRLFVFCGHKCMS